MPKQVLKLYRHPLSSFCHKVLIALYENGTPFEPVMVDLGDPASAAALRAVWPVGKMPVLRDERRNATVPESTVIIEYLDAFYPGPVRFVPAEPDAAWRVRLWDRFFDNYVHQPMQKIVGDHLRPADARDPHGVHQAEDQLRSAYRVIATEMAGGTWAMGEAFTLADCAAAPALFYANTVLPFGSGERGLSAYLGRLMARPSFARALAEAQPYFTMFPMEKKPAVELNR